MEHNFFFFSWCRFLFGSFFIHHLCALLGWRVASVTREPRDSCYELSNSKTICSESNALCSSPASERSLSLSLRACEFSLVPHTADTWVSRSTFDTHDLAILLQT